MLALITVIGEGIDTSDNETHPKKAPNSISFTDGGINISLNEVHSEKANFPIEVTEEGIVI